MLFVLLLLSRLLFAVSSEKLCEKLNSIGDNIQNKAAMSPIVVIGKSGMKIDLPNDQYKLTIEIVTVIKGSLGQWKKPLIIVGNFSVLNSFKNPCHFQSEPDVKNIYFLQVLSESNGEYITLFNPEKTNIKKLAAINATICAGCGKPPSIILKDESASNEVSVVDCIAEGNPIPVVKWNVSKTNAKAKIESIKNGVRFIQSVSNTSNEMYTCKAMNALGNATSSVILKALLFKAAKLISRCSGKDSVLCSGRGKCYEDKSEGSAIFCRCDEGFEGPNCASSTSKIPDDLIQRTPKNDGTNCNNNGNSYENWKTKTGFCICNEKYFGAQCENQIQSRASDKETISRCSSKNSDVCSGHGKCYEDKTDANIMFCRCDEGFSGPRCTNNATQLPNDLIRRTQDKDSSRCTNNGMAYEYWNSRKSFCVCDTNFVGSKCEKKKEGQQVENDEARVVKIIEMSASKMAAKYILIGCLIVLGGCILVVIVILCLWRCYFTKLSRKVKDDDEEKEDNEDECEETTQMKPLTNVNPGTSETENRQILSNFDPNTVPRNAVPPYYNESPFKDTDSNFLMGNGIYDNYKI